MQRRIAYAQNGEDIRIWRAFRDRDAAVEGLTYVDVGANEPRSLSITATLDDLGWRGLLIEADPDLAAELRALRPQGTVVEAAAAAEAGELTFHRIPGTGLGTASEHSAEGASRAGHEVVPVTVSALPLSRILDEHGLAVVHVMTIDVEGAEGQVLAGLDLTRHRPWVLCIEAVEPGTETPAIDWEPRVLAAGYQLATFDGVNRWYVASEHASLAEPLAVAYSALDAGLHGWVPATQAELEEAQRRTHHRVAWQRELLLGEARTRVPAHETAQRMAELEQALASVEASRAWRMARKAGGVARRAKHLARVAVTRLPAPLHRRYVRSRHLKIVEAAYPTLVDASFLQTVPDPGASWISPDGMPNVPPGLGMAPLTEAEQEEIRAWLAEPHDTDALLERRTDGHDDELGRTRAALLARLRLAEAPATPLPATGNCVLVDARSLQSPAFGTRGIGRFAAATLAGVRSALGDGKVVLLVDRGLEPLPTDLLGDCDVVTRVRAEDVGRYSVLVQPSPMTHSAEPLIPLLHSDARKIAVVFDFIPLHRPSLYLRHVGARAEYAAAMDALRQYDELACISHLAQREAADLIGPRDAYVAWPTEIDVARKVRPGTPSGPIVVMTGDEPRKNTFGALAAIGVATAGQDVERDVLVIGMAGHGTRVHHWSIAAAMRPGEAQTAGRLSDDELAETLRTASVVVIPSFDEGLSLPVIEAIMSGANVVASDIPAHRELIGRGSYLVDPRNLRTFSRAVRRYAGTRRSFPRQQATLAKHEHRSLEHAISESVLRHLGRTTAELTPAAVYAAGRGLRVALATPWTPQRSGVADFSATIGAALAERCDLTVVTTADARVDGLRHVSIQQALADPRALEADHDVIVSVIGNSHFHLPFLRLLDSTEAVAVLHDTRMTELYLALRGMGGLEQVMLRGASTRRISPPLDEQIADMRLLQNLALWEPMRRAAAVVTHSPTSAARMEAETGVRPIVLPFANQRVPAGSVDESARDTARDRLGWNDGAAHIASFGFVDLRTKQADLVVEAVAWLTQWGTPATLHFCGSAPEPIAERLRAQAARAGVTMEITGFLDEAGFQDRLLAAHLGLQLRVSPVLGVSGPLSDLSAWGTPAVASAGLVADVGAPEYVSALPDDASTVMVAEAIERALGAAGGAEGREPARQAYLAEHSPQRYAELLHAVLREVAR